MTVQTQVRRPAIAVCPKRSSRHAVDRRLKLLSLGSSTVRKTLEAVVLASCAPTED